jgi:hypothetical protein
MQLSDYSKKHQNSRFAYINVKDFSKFTKRISDIGIDFSIIKKKNSKAITREEEEIYDYLQNNAYLLDDTQPYFDKMFKDKVEFLKRFAEHTEIETILETIINDAINYDQNGYFCYVSLDGINVSDEIKKKVQINFKKIYSLLGWDNGISGWEDFWEFMTVGYNTFEIVYNYKKLSEIEQEKRDLQAKLNNLLRIDESLLDEETKIKNINEKLLIKNNIDSINRKIDFYKKDWSIRIDESIDKYNFFTSKGISLNDINNKEELVPISIAGIKPIPHNSVIPIEWFDKESNRSYKLWKFFKDPNGNSYTVLSDNQIIQVKYNSIPGKKYKFSYLERLIRNFNLTNKLEESRVAWNILNSQFRMEIIVPVGSQTAAKAKETIRRVADKYKEEITINERSGEVSVYGTAKGNYGRTIVMPSRMGNEPKISSINWDGPDLSDMGVVEHFRRNLWRDAYIPSNRFERGGNVGALSLFRAEGIPYDEVAYYNVINKFHVVFSEIIKKPLYIQTILDFPELKIDYEFKNRLSIHFYTQSYFKEAKEAEINTIKINNISQLLSLTKANGDAIYSAKYLFVNKFQMMTEEEWELNSKMIKEENSNASTDEMPMD